MNLVPLGPYYYYHLVCGGQLFAIGSERDQARAQVDQTANLQVRVGATGGGGTNCIRTTHHVAVTSLDTATKQDQR